MKKLITLLAACLALAGYSQDTNSTATGTPLTSTGWLWENIKDSGVLNATNYAFEIYGTYAQKLADGKSHIGGGVLALYNFNQYVGAGIGIDDMDGKQFSLISGNVSLRYPLYPLTWVSKADWAQNVSVTPFALAGLGTPFGGTSGASVSTIEDVGAVLGFGHLLGGQFNIGGCYGQWNNAGDYSGKRMHAFIGWNRGIDKPKKSTTTL